MNRFVKSPRCTRVTLLVMILAAVIAAAAAQRARATSSPWHASQYQLRFDCYGNCGGCDLSQIRAYFPTVGGRTLAVNEGQGCASGPDNQEGETIEVKIKSGGTVVLSGTATMAGSTDTKTTLGTYNGVTYLTSCATGAIPCGAPEAKNTWFVWVEAQANCN